MANLLGMGIVCYGPRISKAKFMFIYFYVKFTLWIVTSSCVFIFAGLKKIQLFTEHWALRSSPISPTIPVIRCLARSQVDDLLSYRSRCFILDIRSAEDFENCHFQSSVPWESFFWRWLESANLWTNMCETLRVPLIVKVFDHVQRDIFV